MTGAEPISLAETCAQKALAEATAVTSSVLGSVQRAARVMQLPNVDALVRQAAAGFVRSALQALEEAPSADKLRARTDKAQADYDLAVVRGVVDRLIKRWDDAEHGLAAWVLPWLNDRCAPQITVRDLQRAIERHRSEKRVEVAVGDETLEQRRHTSYAAVEEVLAFLPGWPQEETLKRRAIATRRVRPIDAAELAELDARLRAWWTVARVKSVAEFYTGPTPAPSHTISACSEPTTSKTPPAASRAPSSASRAPSKPASARAKRPASASRKSK